MIDREKVINGLRDIDMFIAGRFGHEKAKNFLRTIDETITLLKKQEAVRPILTPWIVNDDGEVTVYRMECGKCGIQFYYEDQKYCSECGTPILWGGR